MRQQVVWAVALMGAIGWAGWVLTHAPQRAAAPAAHAGRAPSDSVNHAASPGSPETVAELVCSKSAPPPEAGVDERTQQAFCVREQIINHQLPFLSMGEKGPGLHSFQERCPAVERWLAQADALARGTSCGQLRGRMLQLVRRTWFYGCIDFDAFLQHYRTYRQDMTTWHEGEGACSAMPHDGWKELEALDLNRRKLCQDMAVQRSFPALDAASVARVGADLDACLDLPETPFPL